MKHGRIAIIGAGIAGLSVGSRLASAGCEVVVFEKARGVGGRASTRRSGEHAFDHGAQYFTCRQPTFSVQVEDWCRRGIAAPWEARIRTLGPAQATVGRDDSIRYVGVPGMSALARDLAKNLRVECRKRIAHLEGSAADWSLIAEDGLAGDGRFEAVVVATPAPQALPLLAPAPRLASLAAEVEMQPCQAAMVTFAQRLEVDFGGAFVSGSPLCWVARNESKPGRPSGDCWVLHASPEWSASHLEDSAESVASSLLRVFGKAIGRKLPAVKLLASHRWSLARASQAVADPLLWESELGLGVCGDWTAGTRLEDAFMSGERLARIMLGGSRDLPSQAERAMPGGSDE